MKVLLNPQQIIQLWMIVLLLSGCESISRFSPEINSVKDAVAVSYATIDAGAEVTTDLLKEGVIDIDDAQFCQSILERAFALTEIAERQAIAGKPEGARQILSTVSRLFSDLRQFLGREF